MKELALFYGIGGGSLGTSVLGLQTVCAVECNPHRIACVRSRQREDILQDFPIFEDVTTFNGISWRGKVDIITGGFPCQAFSSAARGRNIQEKNLWPSMFRIIAEAEPNYVFAENVAASAIEQAALDLETVGYKTQGIALSAADLGADHIRKRYWLLAYADDKSQLRLLVNAEMAKLQDFCEGVWQTNPNESRMADGISPKMDRYSACGNGQVPAVAASALYYLATG